MAKTNKGKTVSIRLSELMLEALDAYAFLEEKDRTQVIRDAIARYLDLPKESDEDKSKVLEKKQVSLNQVVDKLSNQITHEVSKLSNQITHEVKRTNSIEMRVDDLEQKISVFMDKPK